ncbi:hypothetical protein C5167_005111 [Papaver somniferum]|uniref:Replication protein A 70 kDa DNA-binding subunit B/D first OB fold domain-containing protein n=1 Tax=Papaver somniferum TaxID=3469 RepID=A0A4Y7J9I9_PAPSO|nr:hypothetical protein C5167_005111 [Papaver somniferum]
MAKEKGLGSETSEVAMDGETAMETPKRLGSDTSEAAMDDETAMETPKRLGSETSEAAMDDETAMETPKRLGSETSEAAMDDETAMETPKRLGSEKELQSRSTFIPTTPAKKTKNRKRNVDSNKDMDSKSSKIPKTGKLARFQQLPDLCHMTKGEIKISGKLRIMRTWEEKNLKTGKLYNYCMILMDRNGDQMLCELKATQYSMHTEKLREQNVISLKFFSIVESEKGYRPLPSNL